MNLTTFMKPMQVVEQMQNSMLFYKDFM